MPTLHPVEANLRALRVSLSAGSRAAALTKYIDLFDPAAQGDGDNYVRAVRLVGLIGGAVTALGEGAYGRAAKSLWGISVDSRGRLLKDRRRLAALELDIATSTFRKYYEERLLQDMAMQIWLSSDGPQNSDLLA